MSERIRLTISVPKEAHDVFTRMAGTVGQSVGRVMGDWLQDTVEGAEFVTAKMIAAREAPKTVMREMQAFARGLVDEADSLIAEERERGRVARLGGLDRARDPPFPPPSPTGGKSPNKGKGKGQKP